MAHFPLTLLATGLGLDVIPHVPAAKLVANRLPQGRRFPVTAP